MAKVKADEEGINGKAALVAKQSFSAVAQNCRSHFYYTFSIIFQRILPPI